MRFGKSASCWCGCQRPPQALNPKLTTATCPASLRTKIGPLSRTHESSIGMGSGSTVAPQRFRTSVSSPGLQIIVSGSKPAMARATPA